MGQPSATEPWGWQFDGHHAVINYFVVGRSGGHDAVLHRVGACRRHTGRYKGTSILQAEQNRGLAMINALTDEQRKKAVLMLAAFAVVAALLGAVGVYGILAYFVVERTREIGVRMALGAGQRQVVRLVLGRGLVYAAIGIALGLAGAAAGTRSLEAMLYGVTPLDGWTFAAVAIAFAAIASYLPARRATHIDPMVALRIE